MKPALNLVLFFIVIFYNVEASNANCLLFKDSDSLDAQTIMERTLEKMYENHFQVSVDYSVYNRVIRLSKEQDVQLIEEQTADIHQNEKNQTMVQLGAVRLRANSKKEKQERMMNGFWKLSRDKLLSFREPYLKYATIDHFRFDYIADTVINQYPCFVLTFKKKSQDSPGAEQGKLYIDMNNYAIVRKVENESGTYQVDFRKEGKHWILKETYEFFDGMYFDEERITRYKRIEQPLKEELESYRSSLTFFNQPTINFLTKSKSSYWTIYEEVPLASFVRGQLKNLH